TDVTTLEFRPKFSGMFPALVIGKANIQFLSVLAATDESLCIGQVRVHTVRDQHLIIVQLNFLPAIADCASHQVRTNSRRILYPRPCTTKRGTKNIVALARPSLFLRSPRRRQINEIDKLIFRLRRLSVDLKAPLTQ